MLLLSALLTAGGCQDEPEPPPLMNAPASVTVEATPPPVQLQASHGGTVVTAGPHPVEVVPHADGVIEAYVVNDVPPAPGAQLTVTVQTAQGPRPVMLAWDDGRYYGVLRGPTIVPGPTQVVYVVDDRAYRGSLDTLVVVRGHRHRRPRAQVVVQQPVAPSAQVVVDAPVPRARIDVQLGVPAPPGVVVFEYEDDHHHGRHMGHHGPRPRGFGHRHHRHHGMRGHR